MFQGTAISFLYKVCNSGRVIVARFIHVDIFTRTENTTLLSGVEGIIRLECCQGQEKSLGHCCIIPIELKFLQHVSDIRGTWLQIQPFLTSISEQFLRISSCQCE